MEKRIFCYTILLALTLFISETPEAQEPNFYSFSVNNGLPSNNIISLTISKKGQLYVGTESGAAMFDGEKFIPFYASGKEDGSLKGGLVETLISSSSGDIWLGSGNGGISILHGENKFQYLNTHLSNNRIRGLFEDRSGNIWIGTDDGLNKYNPNTKTLKIYNTSDGLSHQWVRQITEDKQGFIWVGTWGGGVNRITPETGAIKVYRHEKSSKDSLSDDIVYSMFTDSKGNVWAGTFGTVLNKYNRDCDCFQRHPSNFETVNNNNVNYIWDIEELTDGRLVVATGSGLYFITKEGTEKQFNLIAPLDKSITRRTITSVVQSPDGTIWLGTLGTGVLSIPPQGLTFLNISQRQPNELGVIGKGILSVSQIDGDILISSSTGISAYKQQRNNLRYLHDLFPDIEGHTILRGPQKNLWIASGRQGLHKISDGTTNELSSDFFNRDDEAIFDIARDANSIWIPSWHSGVLHFTPSTGEKTFFKLDSATQPRINAISVKGGDVWVGALNGLYKVSQSTGKLIPHLIETKDAHNHLNSIYDILDLGSNLWLATETGVFKFDKITNTFTKKSPNNVTLPSQSITSDPSGNIWATLGSDIIKINDNNESFQIFNESYLPDKIAFMGNSILSLPSGQIYIGGYDGIVSFDSGSTFKDDFKPRIYINEVTADETISINKGVYTLKGQANNLLITFSTDEGRTPKGLSYEYRVAESQKKWTPFPQNGQLFIAYLPQGNYTIETRVNNGFNTTSDPVKLHISISPPFWKSTIAYTVYLSVGILILLWLYRYRINQLKNREKLLNDTVKARTLELEAQKSTILEQSKRLTEATKEKQKLFETISHELRTPITLILGPIRRLSKDLTDKNAIATATLIERNATRLNRLVNQLMDLSRSHVPPQKRIEATDLSKVAQEVTETFSPYVNDAGLTLSSQIGENIYTTLSRDEVEKLLSNLLSNAIKYNQPNGRISLDVHSDNSKVIISISDTGIGIPEENIKNIFTRFYRVNPEQNITIEGSGIGLSIIKDIIEGVDGSIEVKSEENTGSTFTVTLPASEPLIFTEQMQQPDIHIQHLSSIPEETADTQENPRLLLIDDNQDILTYVSSVLSDTYDITTAMNGQEGIDIAKTEIPDIIISDVMMPGVDGLALLETLKNDELTNHIPIVMLTAKGDDNSKITGLKLKADDYLGKPFNEEELTLRLRNILDAREVLKQKFIAEWNQQEEGGKPVTKHSDFLVKLDNIIKLNYGNPAFSVSELAKEAAVGERQLLRKLKAETNMGPKEYIRLFRLHKSTLLLQAGNTASYTASEVGFSSLAYFSSCFKAQYGCPPTQYKK